jgi:hypothetical protein
MKKCVVLYLLLSAVSLSHGAVWKFKLSPPGTDKAVGMSWQNEVPAVTNSTGTGDEVGPGISFDTTTLIMSLSVGYGSAFGFTNLSGPATAMHIHGEEPVGVAAPVIHSLITNNVPDANPTNGGFIGGTVLYLAEEVPFLLGGSNYINIHTALNPAGEIRGQLIPFNTPPTVTCPPPSTNECTGAKGTLVALSAQVGDADGDQLMVVWKVDGAAVQTNTVTPPAGTNAVTVPVGLMAMLSLGHHTVSVSASDGKAAPVTCSTTATIVDTTPPVITRAVATPNMLWPPDHKMVNVAVSVTATDLCSTVTCKIKSVKSSEAALAKGSGHTSPDWVITGPLTVQLRAERSGQGSGRTYTITVECADTSGNKATRDVIVSVPHDRGKH